MASGAPFAITPTMLARAATIGAVSATLSARENVRAWRVTEIAAGLGLGGLIAATASGAVDPSRLLGADAVETGEASLPVAVGIGAGTAVAVVAVSEIGLRLQGRFEEWSDRVTGRPRLTVALLAAAISLGTDLVERQVSGLPEEATATS